MHLCFSSKRRHIRSQLESLSGTCTLARWFTPHMCTSALSRSANIYSRTVIRRLAASPESFPVCVFNPKDNLAPVCLSASVGVWEGAVVRPPVAQLLLFFLSSWHSWEPPLSANRLVPNVSYWAAATQASLWSLPPPLKHKSHMMARHSDSDRIASL